MKNYHFLFFSNSRRMRIALAIFFRDHAKNTGNGKIGFTFIYEVYDFYNQCLVQNIRNHNDSEVSSCKMHNDITS